MTDRRIAAEDDPTGTHRVEAFEIEFDGRPVRAFPGETVGAALTAAGISTVRATRRYGRPRGIFCGIGICFDCLVTIDGSPNQRACVTGARPGMAIRTQIGPGEIPGGG